MSKKQIVNNVEFSKETPKEVIKVILDAMESRIRIRVDYGNTKTGKSWNEIYDVTGYVGRSTGTVKIPLLVHNSRSYGGGGILDGSIIKIEYSNKNNGGVLYQHKKYHK